MKIVRWSRSSVAARPTASVGRDRPVRPDLEDEPVVVRGLPDARRLDVVVDAPHGRMDGVDRDVADPHVLVEVLVRRDVAAARSRPASPSAAGRSPRASRSGASGSRISTSASAWMSAAVTLPLRSTSSARIFSSLVCILMGICFRLRMMSVTSSTTPGQRRKLVQHALDLDRGDRGALDRGEQHPPQRVAHRRAEAALERLRVEPAVRRRQRLLCRPRGASASEILSKVSCALLRRRLLGIQLDDQLLLDRQLDVFALGQLQDRPRNFSGVELEPRRHAARPRRLDRGLDLLVGPALLLDRDDLALSRPGTTGSSPSCALTVTWPCRTSWRACAREAAKPERIDDVVQPPLELLRADSRP